ncbi:carbon-nitrogen hydrolase family protein [Aureliella helgolandensis]|uniref:N-carbamoyl-D-amino acid hydrolase n=1 Tax=Aureliella helgolandensis TaxID=2527968 RepID=A0A518FZT5_9BACT|nr:carbon-nitrogen hydrolase family protein [Aureliella helgolandensis]QDV21826.1 N-carbamoyl-D-amino acid hydrolase [Aureliella helgolandensis]
MPAQNSSPKTPVSARRQFLATAASGTAALAGLGVVGAQAQGADLPKAQRPARLPREVTIATVCQDGLRESSPENMVRAMLKRAEQAASQQPDLVCFPEVFTCANLSNGRPELAKFASTPLCPVTQPVADFAKRHQCYVICPTYTQHDGRYFNAAVLFDRSGRVAGEYQKIRLTLGEIENGLTPGPDTPPVFETDFGRLGCQICFDMEWMDGWQKLRKAGAEIVVWPSAFAGGSMVNTMAALHRYVVVSSTRKDTSKVCDIDGAQLAATSRWNTWAVTTVNLEKVFMHTWPFVQHFEAVLGKYGPRVSIKTHSEEEWSILESHDANLRVADILQEFGLEQIDAYLARAEQAQQKAKS